MKEGVLIVNAKSRQGAEAFVQAAELLDESQIVLKDKVLCQSPVEIKELIIKYRDEVPIIFLGGGDGTQGLGASLLTSSQTAQAVLPLGTGNAFARDLGIAPEPATAIKSLINSIEKGEMPKEIDLGTVNDRVFVNVATLGLTSHIVRNLTNPLKKRFGKAAYLVALIRGFESLRPFLVQMETSSGRFEGEAFQVVIGNGRTHAGPFPIHRHASLFSHQLSIYILPGASKLKLMKYALGLPTGHHTIFEAVHSQSATQGNLLALPSQNVIVDGEKIGRIDIRFKVIPSGLKVIFPLK